jgi:signal transduction histidine kinase
VRTYLLLGTGALLAGAILSVAAILWGAGRISTPVDDLVRQVEAAVESNYRTRVRSESISELQRLAVAFNHMIEQIGRYRAGLRQYVAAITHSQEEERRRIARELHDDTIQSLVAISRRLELVQASLDDPQQAQEQLSTLQELLQSTVEGVRRFSRELRPTLLEDLGLVPALRRLVRELTAETVELDMVVRGDSQGIAPDVELAIYRIAQEAINNVRRHAQAHQVEVQLDMSSESIHLLIKDDGQGFRMASSPSELAQQGSFGLMGIQERVELLGGRMDIHSEAGQGTRLEVWLPRSAESVDVA